MEPPNQRITPANSKTNQRNSNAACQKSAETALLEWIGLPEEVELFEEFEELAKTYTIEAPFVSRSQIELMFDVYDGRKLSQSLTAANLEQSSSDNQKHDYKLSLPASESSGFQRARDQVARRSVGGLKSIARRGRRRLNGPNLSWCKLLFVHNEKWPTNRVKSKVARLRCCLSKSETGHDLWLSPSSSTTSWPSRGQQLGSSSDDYLSAALADGNEETTCNNQNNKEEEAELKAEVLQLIGPLMQRLRRSSTLSLDGGLASSICPEQQQQQQVILDGSVGAAGRISVCLFDMKNRTIRIKSEAENGRRWWRFESILQDLRWLLRMRATSWRKQDNRQSNLSSDRYFEQRHLSRSSLTADERCTRLERLSRDDFNRLIAITKDSLNHLIDAQLMLRNKLANELQQQRQQQNQLPVHLQPAQQQQCLIARENEYESLLRNNFNLLKVWQNFEETKRLACFVCEPIKANLSDLFWFSRQRFALVGSPQPHCNDFLSSPLVSLDAIQVKRGLIQILEALHYLHAICKLVHRNVNPSNILIAANDNWKLSGLQFAIRFESATISESASIMANEGSSMLRYSVTASSQSGRLRRQRTLTKCEEFSRKPKCGDGILQPEVDYLAPEMWKSSKCSHKSDLFSYGLIMGQTYDLFRHKPPINCGSNLDAYERELKKLVERRKLKLSRLVPLEMRDALLATLECEPNLRPSANYALQLFRRPIELCKVNDDSLRHLRRSLRYLDNACPPMGTPFGLSSSSHPSPCPGQQPSSNPPCSGKPTRGRGSYFRKVTSASANQAPRSKQQPKTLHLLNLLLRGVDSLAHMGHPNTVSTGYDAGSNQNIAQTTSSTSSAQFASLRNQFESTFESLRQLFGKDREFRQLSLGGSSEDHASDWQPGSLFAASKPADQRSLMLVIALHRRLLDQLGRMRMELPPVCRLAGANSALNRPTPRHRALAEMEDKLYGFVSRDSLRKLAPILTDPLLKLDEADGQSDSDRASHPFNRVVITLWTFDEKPPGHFARIHLAAGRAGPVSQFLLLYELIGDLFAFVGQKCRQNFLQRGKQLLNELTPVTGCPSSSSSDDEEDNCYDNIDTIVSSNNNNLVSSDPFQQQSDTCAPTVARSSLFGGSRETLHYNPPVIAASLQHHQHQHHQQQQMSTSQNNSGKMSHTMVSGASRRFSEYPEQTTADQTRHHRGSAGDYLLQQPQLPTRISITAPSPMGSLRDINSNNPTHSGQQQFGAKRNHQNHADLCHRTSELSLRSDHDESNLVLSEGEEEAEADTEASTQKIEERARSASDQGVDKMGDKSRSQLIDELLRTINDDSFTADYVDFNGKLHQASHHRAALATSSVVPAPPNPNHQSASQLANVNRPKSALDSIQSSSSSTSPNQQRRQSSRPGPNHYQQLGSGGAPSSTFDNVIRRMSTNLVQNFNKMSSNTLGSTVSDQNDTSQTGAGGATIAASSSVRREKSSNYANSLYVDNQVPARRHSDNTINIPRIQVALSSPQAGNSRFGLNQRSSASASKLANKWKLSAKTNQREASDKLSPNLSGALGYMRRHSSGNTTGNDQSQSNGQISSSNLLLNASPFKTKSSSNLGLDFLLSNRSMKRRYSAASMLGHQTQRKAENLIDAGMKSVQNMFG